MLTSYQDGNGYTQPFPDPAGVPSTGWTYDSKAQSLKYGTKTLVVDWSTTYTTTPIIKLVDTVTTTQLARFVLGNDITKTKGLIDIYSVDLGTYIGNNYGAMSALHCYTVASPGDSPAYFQFMVSPHT